MYRGYVNRSGHVLPSGLHFFILPPFAELGRRMTAKPLKKRVQHQACGLVLWQLAGVILLSLLGLLLHGVQTGTSILAGGMTYGLPNLLFVWVVFRFAGAQQMVQFMTAFMVGEMMKLIFSAILFLVIVKTMPVSLLSTLVGYVGAIVSFWIVCMWHFSRQAVPKENILRS